MRGAEKHNTQGSSGRYSTRSNRASARSSSRKEAPPPLNPTTTTRSHQLPPPIDSNPGPFQYLPGLLPPTTTGMVSSEQNNIEPSPQFLPMTQAYPPSTMQSTSLNNDTDTSNLLPSPGATTPTTGTSIPSPPPNNTNTNTNIPDYPHSAYNYGTWTTEEDKTLLNARGQGHHWAQIQRTHFPSKTANACRKRYERLMERRGIYDLDREKLEKVAHEYMGMRKEIWSGLAARVGERWNVVEAQCMSSGLRTIQLNARSHARRQRHESRVSQRTTTSAPTQPYPYLNTTDTGMMDMLNHHHQHGGSNVGNTLLAPVGFAPISPLDDEHPVSANHHGGHDYRYNHNQYSGQEHGGGWHNGHPSYGSGNSNSSSNTPTAEMVTPTTSTSTGSTSADQEQGYRDYPQQQQQHHHQPEHASSYGPGPASSTYSGSNHMGYNSGYSMPGPSHRR